MINRITIFNSFLILFFVLGNTVAFGLETERDKEFSKNKFLQIKSNGDDIESIAKKLTPNLDLKGASDEEEKEILSAMFNLGFNLYKISYEYVNYPLDLKLNGTTVKEDLVLNLRKLRDLMAELDGGDRLLELIDEIRIRIEKENTKVKEHNSETAALLSKMFESIGKHIEDTFGLSYKIYYSFGLWTNQVMTRCEERIIYDEIITKKLTKEQREEILERLTKDLKSLLVLAENYKSSVKELTKKAVVRNLDNLYQASAEIKGFIEVSTAKRLYDNCLNIYYALLPTQEK